MSTDKITFSKNFVFTGVPPTYGSSALTGDEAWMDKERRIRLIRELDTEHIENIIKGLTRGNWYWGQKHKLPQLKAELQRRENG